MWPRQCGSGEECVCLVRPGLGSHEHRSKSRSLLSCEVLQHRWPIAVASWQFAESSTPWPPLLSPGSGGPPSDTCTNCTQTPRWSARNHCHA